MKYFLIAGERSGDEHGAGLVKAINKLDRSAIFTGYGGECMRNAGVDILHDYSEFSAFGIVDVLRRIHFFRKLINECLAQIHRIRPDFLILIDFPGFNLRIARGVKNVKVIYFIPPKIWAWGSWRLNSLEKYTDQIHFIFPFESKVYQRRTLKGEASYIGNPTKWRVRTHSHDLAFMSELRFEGKRIMAFLPGSRSSEVTRHLSLIPGLSREFQNWQIVIPMVENLSPSFYHLVEDIKNVKLVAGKALDVLALSEVAVVASGTATLEAALIGTPQVVIYKTNWITYLVARVLVRVKHISLVNILAGRLVVPELIQHHCNPDSIHFQVKSILNQMENQKKISGGYSEISNLLGDSDPFERSAKLLLNLPMQP